MRAKLQTLALFPLLCLWVANVLPTGAALGANDPLPRRAWLGAALEPAANGVRVRDVVPDSTAAAAGIVPGDILSTFDGKPLTDIPSLLAQLRPLRAGQESEMTLTRDGQSKRIAMTFKAWPQEPTTDDYTIEYADVSSSAGRLRTITNVPRAKGKRPALFIIQGLGAATLDNPRPGQPVDQPVGMGVYRTLADAAARAGYITMRVDKAGCGDSEGNPATLDFTQELDGYRAALAALKNRDDVDPERIALFGHSMGGVFAPILAAEIPVRGVAVYGTVLKTWPEYLVETTRRQRRCSPVPSFPPSIVSPA